MTATQISASLSFLSLFLFHSYNDVSKSALCLSVGVSNHFLLRQIWISGAHPWQSKFTFKGKKKVLKSGLADVKLLCQCIFQTSALFKNIFSQIKAVLSGRSQQRTCEIWRANAFWVLRRTLKDCLSTLRKADVLLHNGIKFVDSHRQEKRQQVCNLIYLLGGTM